MIGLTYEIYEGHPEMGGSEGISLEEGVSEVANPSRV